MAKFQQIFKVKEIWLAINMHGETSAYKVLVMKSQRKTLIERDRGVVVG
jgi:hypothetical protein